MARRSINPQGPYTDPQNLDQKSIETARDYYRQQREADFGNILGGAVHMGQEAQAIIPDPQGLRGLMQALKERNAGVGSSLNLPNAPTGQPSTFDPSFQTTAVPGRASLAGLSRLLKGKKAQV